MKINIRTRQGSKNRVFPFSIPRELYYDFPFAFEETRASSVSLFLFSFEFLLQSSSYIIHITTIYHNSNVIKVAIPIVSDRSKDIRIAKIVSGIAKGEEATFRERT